MTLLSFLAGVAFFSAGLLAFSTSSAAPDHPTASKSVNRTPREMRLVLIDGPPFDEHLAQLAARIERIAGKDEQVGRLALFQRAVCLVESKEGSRPGR